ncbi:unnamed protein product [Mytilus coruscus]|uniref:Uncharacterized protein n=1 Tax=Mytilus coruscus TaxID=42192 RepID=A0A6J7ZYD7_MYTCO|nr:unnamed protein product [Mytilus coruscus]
MDSEEWNLIFKAATGVGNGSVYELFTGPDILNVDNVHAQSLLQPVKEHLKSDIVNQCPELGISEVLVRIHNNGEEVAYFLFDGVGSNKTNWFSLARLKQSSYADFYNSTTNASINFFSIIGTWGCPSWEAIYLTEVPAILYSPLQTMAHYEKVDRSNITCVRMCSTPVQQDASSYCYKSCDSQSDIHNIDLEQKVKQLKEKLTIDRKSTSSSTTGRKNNCPYQ